MSLVLHWVMPLYAVAETFVAVNRCTEHMNGVVSKIVANLLGDQSVLIAELDFKLVIQ